MSCASAHAQVQDAMIGPTGVSARCFISHAWSDDGHEFALHLLRHLERRDIEGWVDEKAIRGGEHLERSIRLGILGRCNVFLAVMTQAWTLSSPCQEELDLALERRARDGFQIIPLLRQETLPVRPRGLEHVAYIDFIDKTQFGNSMNKLVKSIQSAFFLHSVIVRLSSGTRDERFQAAQHLCVLANPFVAPILATRLEVEVDSAVKHWVALAIGRTGSDIGLKALKKALAGEDNEFTKLGIYRALDEWRSTSERSQDGIS